MTSLQPLIDLISSLKSNKKRGKLEAFENLLGLLNQENIISNLHSNSLINDKFCSWNILFTNIHNASIIIADENISKSKQIPEKYIQIIQNVVPMVVQKSVYEKRVLIESNLLVSCVLNILEVDSRAKLFGSTYVNILNKYVLSNKRIWYNIKEEYWNGLKNMCKKSFKNHPPRTPSHIFLEILCDVIKHSSKSCQSFGMFLDLFEFLKDILVRNKLLGLPYEISLLHLTNMLCLQSAIEFRYKVCEFMEDVLDFVIDFCGKNNMDLNIRVYHFLMIMLSLHNPNGVPTNDKSAYFCNLNNWKSQIKKIYFFCHDELQNFLKNVSVKEICPEFLDLFVDISHLVYINDFNNFTVALEFDDYYSEPKPPKKCKYSFDTTHFSNKINSEKTKQLMLYAKFENLILDIKSTDGWFWLQFLEVLINKYPDDLKNQYQKLISVLSEIICDKKDSGNIKTSLRCLYYILEVENLTKSNDLKSKNQNDIWNEIGMELVRCLQSEDYFEIHVLLRALISHSKIYNGEPIFKIYCNTVLRSNMDNFKTLCFLCQYYIIPEAIDYSSESLKNVRETLILWLLQDKEKYPPNDLAKILISLSVKRFEEKIEKQFDKTNILISNISINDFCKIITTNYKKVAFKDLEFNENTKIHEDNNIELRVDINSKFKLFGYLDVRWQSLYQTLMKETSNFSEKVIILENCIWFCELLCYLISYIDKANTPLDDYQFLEEKLELMLHSCTTKTLNLFEVKFFNLNSIFNFYASDFHLDVQKLIREPNFINLNLLQFLFEIFAKRNEKSESNLSEMPIHQSSNITSNSKFSLLITSAQSNFHFQNLTEAEKIVVHAVELLCQYITIPGCYESNHFQSTLAIKIVDNLVKDDNLKNYSNFHLQLIFRVAYSFTEYGGIPVAVLNGCLNLIVLVFDMKFLDLELFITMLQVLKNFLPLVQRIGNAQTHFKFMEIVKFLRSEIFCKKNCGIKASSKFVEFLAEISKYDLNTAWAVLQIDGMNCLIYEEIISFLKHSFHEVRLTAAHYVGYLFLNQNNMNESMILNQKKMLKQLFFILKDYNCTYFKDKEIVSEYSNCVISSVALISWANIICTSRFWRKKALFYLIYLTFLKQLKQSELKDIIQLICKKLNISDSSKFISGHFTYLFYKWNKRGLNVEDFPYYLLYYKEFETFIKNELHIIISVFCLSEQFDKITTLSAKIKTSQKQILKECYPFLISFVMPNLIASTDCEIARKCQKIKRFIDMELPAKTSIQYFTENLDLVIYNMVKNIYDPEYLIHLCKFSGNTKSDKNLLDFNGMQVKKTLRNLSVSENKPLLGKVALEMPSLIEKIFILLLGDIENAMLCDYKIFAFYKYIFFVEIVSEATCVDMRYSRINAFIIRDVIYSLAAITKNNKANEIFENMSCECIRKIADAYLPKFNKIFGQFLPMITSILTPLVKSSNKKALNVLNFLICQNYENLEEAIVLLELFPDDKIFKNINEHIENKGKNVKNLKCYLQRFIKSRNNKSFGCKIESLKYLRNMLSTKKDDLKEMYDDLTNLRGFSEDCKTSLLHQLICILVELASMESIEVRIEATKCLGELGPSNLTTLVLRPETNLTLFNDSNSTTIARFFKSAIINLSNLLISDNYLVKKAASKALYATLSIRQTKELLLSLSDNINTFECLEPFIPTSYFDFQLIIRTDDFGGKLSQEKLWKPDNHEKWIVNLVDVLLQLLSDCREIMSSYRELVHINWQFAENIFAIILDLVVTSEKGNYSNLICKNFYTFFEFYFNYANKSPVELNKKSVQCMLNAIDYIRVQKNHEGIYQQNFLTVNYLHVARAALYCSAYFTSIFYAELWFEEKKKANALCSDLNTLCELFPEESTALTEILRECYSRIGNSDGIHGCGYMHILNSFSEIQHYEHVKNWNLSMLHHDVQLSMGNKDFEIGLYNSLERSGMIYVLNNIMQANNFNEFNSLSFKCAAHLSDWTLLHCTQKTTNKIQSEYFDKYYYFALKAFLNQDDITFQNETYRARNCVITELRNCSLESTKNLYLPLTNLQRLQELEEFVTIAKDPSQNDLLNLHTKWRKQDSLKYSEFKLIESIWTSRTIFIKNVLEKANNSSFNDCLRSILCELYYKIIVAARKEKKYEVAIRMLSYVSSIKAISQEIIEKLNLEKPRILWETGNKEIGKFLLNHGIKTNTLSGELQAKGLRIYGDWMVETKSENSHEIIKKYFLKSISQSKNKSSNLIESYASLAKFADSNYEQLNDYLSSPLFETKKNLINTQNDLALELRQELGWNQNREKKMAYLMASKQVAIDENEIKNNKLERDSYLNLAIKYYLLSLKEGEKYNLLVFRIIALWLNNANNEEVINQLKKSIHQIPTYKFLCLLPQLIPRMADVCLISTLIEQILQDHPHHTLPLLFAISNSYEDLRYNGTKIIPSTSRVTASKSMLEKFKKDNKLKNFVFEMEQFSTALIELANYNILNKEALGTPIRFPENLKIKKIQNFKSVAVPSINIPYEKNCKYDKIVTVHKFEENFYLVGGVNLPKKITCIGSDGIGRLLLVKGRDDLRQDAVMQQVFGIMNSLLSQNVETKKRKLIIRTYRVVPLSQRSGIIEWCKATQPLSMYLTGPDGKSGAHKKFNPNDILASECRSRIRKVFSLPEVTNEDKLKVFLDICKEFHPAFHYFFLEKFPAAGVWFERRLAYVHSVATSSMIGYILGIGDRHVQNILIDNLTAEVIHIDLGIAFEQGKILPTPETVPFRLTRDIVDGMGLNGVEGDFRISCIKTMEVLRNNKDTILTLLEVLLYDPLYTWTITPEKAYLIQGHTETSSTTTDRSSQDLETNKMAERALIRLKQKLQGIDTNCMATNVDGQVSYLIQQARDFNNLCRLFHGWQAYL